MLPTLNPDETAEHAPVRSDGGRKETPREIIARNLAIWRELDEGNGPAIDPRSGRVVREQREKES